MFAMVECRFSWIDVVGAWRKHEVGDSLYPVIVGHGMDRKGRPVVCSPRETQTRIGDRRSDGDSGQVKF